jgi:hypothetical protein
MKRVYFKMITYLTFSSDQKALEFIRAAKSMDDSPNFFEPSTRRQYRARVRKTRILQSWKRKLKDEYMRKAA